MTDLDTTGWVFAFDLPPLGTMRTATCIVSFRVDGGSPTIYSVNSANPRDPFGEGDVTTVAKVAFGYLDTWWKHRNTGKS